MNFIRKSCLLVALAILMQAAFRVPAQPTPAPDPDAARLKAIAEFTQKMKDANYPALFDKAAKEFNVPPDVLKGVSFAETRWTQLEWPPGETASPDNGMPRSYGIMALMDNNYLGHSLPEAAKLIGQDPAVLKTDVYQNMRGGAALLRKLYDETPKPADAQGDQIESWRKAIVKYCGIPQPELSESHALRVYEFMNLGYHQYGLEWDAHPVNLGPMREEVAKIREAARLRAETQLKSNEIPEGIAETNSPYLQNPLPTNASVSTTNTPSPKSTEPDNAENLRHRPRLMALIIALLVIGLIYIWKRKGRPA